MPQHGSPDSAEDERALVSLCRAGDKAALERLLQSQAPRVQRIGYRLIYNPSDVEDFSQEVMIRIVRSLPQFRGDVSLRTWTTTIAVNLARNYRRGFSRLRLVFSTNRAEPRTSDSQPEDSLPDRQPDPERSLLQREAMRYLAAALHELPQAQKEALMLCEIEGLPYDEIALITGAPRNTVATRIATARRQISAVLRERLGHDWPTDRK